MTRPHRTEERREEEEEEEEEERRGRLGDGAEPVSPDPARRGAWVGSVRDTPPSAEPPAFPPEHDDGEDEEWDDETDDESDYDTARGERITKYSIWNKALDEMRADPGVGTRRKPDYQFQQLCDACRRGDLPNVAALVEGGTVDVNRVDNFDYSPLILSSLCGHYEVVEYLLEHGALCERDTFTGERCLYGALNDRIRNLLLSYDVSKAYDVSQPFAAHLSALFGNGAGTGVYGMGPLQSLFSDFAFVCEEEDAESEFRVHRFILSSQSPSFAESFASRWRDKARARLAPAVVSANVFRLAMQWLYLESASALSNAAAADMHADVKLVAKKLQLDGFAEMCGQGDPRGLRDLRKAQIVKAQDKLEQFLHDRIFAQAITVRAGEEAPMLTRSHPSFPDVVLRVQIDDDDVTGSVCYPVHKAMLCRSEYWYTMFTGGFSEGQTGDESTPLPTITLDCDPAVAEIVLSFLYTDRADVPLPIALETLFTADMLLLDKERSLKSLAAVVACSSELMKSHDAANGLLGAESDGLDYALAMLRTGWETSTDRLEQWAAEWLARHLERVVWDARFHTAVAESSARIQSRQETDTIELVDDIRFYLARRHSVDPDNAARSAANAADLLAYSQHLELVDALLQDMGLDA